MPAVSPTLTEFTSEQLSRWQQIQESLSRITGLAVWTIAPGGKTIGRPSLPPELCLLLRSHPLARAICNKDCVDKSWAALRDNAPVFFRCHADLRCFAAPLRSLGKPVGVILGGQVLDGPPPLDTYRDLAKRCGLPEKTVRDAVSGLSIGNEKTIRQAAEFITETADVIFSGWESQGTTSHRLSLLSNLLSLGREFNPAMDSRDLYPLVLNSLVVLFNLESAAIFTPEGGNGAFRARCAFGAGSEQIMQARFHPAESLPGRQFVRGGAWSSDDQYLLLRAGFPEQVRRITLFPLLSGDTVLGFLAVCNQSLPAEEQSTIATFASQVSLFLQNSRLKEELGRRIATLGSLTRFQERLSDPLEMDDLLSLIFEEVAAMAKAERASLMLLNEKSRELLVKLVKGRNQEILRNCSIPMERGPASLVVSDGEPLLVRDMEKDGRFGRASRPSYRTPSFVIIPLKSGGRTIGVLNVADKITGELYDEGDLELLRSMSVQATVALERAELYELSRELKKISITDSLTKLLNRRYFQERATEEVERSRRYDQPLSLIMIDVDDFKHYNDRHGHPAGDGVLQGLAKVIKASVRTVDVVSRYGGEEFAVLSPNTGRSEAFRVAERICSGVRERDFPKEREQPGGELTVSAGVATFPEDAADLEQLIGNADKALYLSKRAGKNRATAYRAIP